MKKLLPAAAIIAAVFAWQHYRDAPESAGVTGDAVEDLQSGDTITGEGTVVRILADDNEGSRHQRFILELASGRTLLITHNIDVGLRIESLREGDRVEFSGIYEPNGRGGVVHWTHHDPQEQHVPGWLRHAGRTYD